MVLCYTVGLIRLFVHLFVRILNGSEQRIDASEERESLRAQRLDVFISSKSSSKLSFSISDCKAV